MATSSEVTTNDDIGRHPSSRDVSRGAGQLGYVPGLDGLRAISVLVVLAFHFRPDHSLLTGGFLGVEIFFVISGYLITALMLEERRTRGRVNLAKFWMRRIRRLFAALYATLLTVGLVVAVFYNDELGKLRSSLFAGAFYVTNWQQILGHVQYGDDSLRTPLGHLWSLAVEEQFYLFWPLVFSLGMFLFARRWKWVILVGTLTSWLWMAHLIAQRPRFHGAVLLQSQKNQIGDVFNRVYLATDTRAAGLLLGAFVAFVWVPRKLRGQTGKNAARVLDGAAIGAALLLVVLVLTAELHSVWLYPWGFILVDLCSVVLIAATVHPVSHVGRLLGVKPLRAIGVRSYGIYLWGIAIFEFTRPGVGFDLDWSGSQMFALRLVLIVVVAEVSYRWIELPVRRGVLGRMWHVTRRAEGKTRERLVVRWQVVGVTLALVTGSLSIAAFAAKAPVEAKAAHCSGDDILLHPELCPIHPASTSPSIAVTTMPLPTKSTRPGTTSRTNPPKVESNGYSFTAVGDSVMLGAQNTLTDRLTRAVGPTMVNADVGRQGQVCLQVLQSLRDVQKILAPVVIVHCGNNGFLPKHFVDQVMAIVGPRRHVVFVTLKVPRQWEGANNAEIGAGAKRYRNTRLLDWHVLAAPLPPNYFAKDTFHLTGPGVAFYVDAIYNFLRNQRWL